MRIGYTPSDSHDVTGCLLVESEEPTGCLGQYREVRTVLYGERQPRYHLTLNPAAINYGTVTVGQASRRTFTVKNTGAWGQTIGVLLLNGL